MRVIFLQRFFLLGVLVAAVLLSLGGVFSAGFSEEIISVLAEIDRRLPIYAVDTSEKKLAISFDAAWGADRTERLLEILKKHNVKTTFFLTGIWVQEYPEMVKKIAAAGHEIGNHSSTHPHCAALSPKEIAKEIQETEEMIYNLTGKRTRLFRPPFGEYNNKVIKTAESLGYQVVQWSVDSLDWMDIGKEQIIERVLKQAHPGAIVLFHNNAKYTPDALPVILEHLQEQGYKIVPISELLLKGDCYIEKHTGIQKKRQSRDKNDS